MVKQAVAKPASGSKAQGGLQSRLAKLGIQRDFDLVLHLPLRHEDETSLTPIGAALQGSPVQVQGRVRAGQQKSENYIPN